MSPRRPSESRKTLNREQLLNHCGEVIETLTNLIRRLTTPTSSNGSRQQLSLFDGGRDRH